MRVPRPLRWLAVLIALFLGWLAGGLLQESRAEREMRDIWRDNRPPQNLVPQDAPTHGAPPQDALPK